MDNVCIMDDVLKMSRKVFISSLLYPILRAVSIYEPSIKTPLLNLLNFRGVRIYECINWLNLELFIQIQLWNDFFYTPTPTHTNTKAIVFPT